jgi:hypothetical protein
VTLAALAAAADDAGLSHAATAALTRDAAALPEAEWAGLRAGAAAAIAGAPPPPDAGALPPGCSGPLAFEAYSAGRAWGGLLFGVLAGAADALCASPQRATLRGPRALAARAVEVVQLSFAVAAAAELRGHWHGAAAAALAARKLEHLLLDQKAAPVANAVRALVCAKAGLRAAGADDAGAVVAALNAATAALRTAAEAHEQELLRLRTRLERANQTVMAETALRIKLENELVKHGHKLLRCSRSHSDPLGIAREALAIAHSRPLPAPPPPLPCPAGRTAPS